MEQNTLISSGAERTKGSFRLSDSRIHPVTRGISKTVERTRSGFCQLLLLENW